MSVRYDAVVDENVCDCGTRWSAGWDASLWCPVCPRLAMRADAFAIAIHGEGMTPTEHVTAFREMWAQQPLTGHAGDCAKVTHATVSGATDWPCTCDNGDRAS